MVETKIVVDTAPENRASNYTTRKLYGKPKLSINNRDWESNYTTTDTIKHSTPADDSPSPADRKDDISSVGSEHDEENVRNNSWLVEDKYLYLLE